MRFFKYINTVPENPTINGVLDEFKPGDVIAVRRGVEGGYRWETSKVTSDGSINPSSITVEEWGRLNQLQQADIDKLKTGIYTKAEVDTISNSTNNRIDNLQVGYNGSVRTSQTLPQLNALTDGVYRAQTSGTYANSLIAKGGFLTTFRKTGTTWVLEEEVKLPSADLTTEADPTGQLFNKLEDVFPNYYVNNSGDLIFNNGGFSYAKINLSNKGDNTKITISGIESFVTGDVHKYGAFYQGSTKLSAQPWVDMSASTTYNIPVNADNLILTIKTPQSTPSQIDNIMVNYGDTALPLEPVKEVVIEVDGVPIKGANLDVYSKSQTYSRQEVNDLIPEPIEIDKGQIISKNIANPSNIMNGLVSTTSGLGTTGNVAWRMIWFPCNGNEDIAIGGWYGSSAGIAFFSGAYPTTPYNSTNIISSGTVGSQGIVRSGGKSVFKTPSGCTWFAITIKNNNETDSVYSELMVVKGTQVLPYVPYGNINVVEGIESEPISASYIKIGDRYISTDNILLSGNSDGLIPKGMFYYELSDSKVLTLKYEEGSIVGLLGRDEGYSRNNVFEFQSFNIAGVSRTLGDESAPVHAMNETLGGNHGGRSWLVTISSHGFTNVDIGTLFTQGGKTFVLARIVNSSQLQFISQNIGTTASPAYNLLEVGTISRGVSDYTISAIDTTPANQQVYPFIKNHTRKLIVNGIEVESGSSGIVDKVEVHETYEIKTLPSVYDNLVARAGTTDEPDFNAATFMKVSNVYRFTAGMACLVLVKNQQLMNTSFADIMANQSAPIGDISSVQYYIPNSNPLNASVDLRKPKVINWSASIPGTAVNVGTSPDPTNPPHRVIQYRGNVGYMTGYLKDRGVGKNITNYTNVMFELRNNTGKIYPHPVEEVKVGNPLLSGSIFSIGMYRVYTDLSKTRVGNRLSVFTVPVDEELLVYVDYSGSMVDNIKINEFDLSGKSVEVVESKNATLKSDMYIDGMVVESAYIEGQTSYIILKIK